MKISHSWLQAHIPTEHSPEEIAEILTRTGLEVDEHYSTGIDPEGLEGLLVGYVKSVSAHPNADKLSLTQVDIGEDDDRPIICGAPNVEAGQKVIVAPPGTTVRPIEGEPMKIKKAKIRGEVSEGMICSAAEIGLSEDAEGILVLDEDAGVGSSVRELYEGSGDHVFDIDITPNRADAISVLGVARDLDAYLKVHEDRSPRKKVPAAEISEPEEESLPVEVEVADAEDCPRYCGLTIQGVTVGPSPEWLQERLKSIGAVPINNVVDVTNFVLHEIGQPLHAFDAASVDGQRIIVDRLQAGTKFTTLDEEERSLTGEELMICNGKREPLCMAGVLGGISSGVSDGTQDVFLESACFDPTRIRKGASAHGITTEASFRFERGVDPEITRFALERAAELIQELAGGRIASKVRDTRPEGSPWAEVDLNYERIARQVGDNLDKEWIRKVLEALEMEVQDTDEEGCKVRIPPFRVDVTREADVLEEILRIHGYDRIPLPERLRATVSHSSPSDMGKVRARLSEFLVSRGFYEIVSNSLVHSEKAGEWHDTDREVRILNPISSELDVLRQSLVHSAVPVLSHNVKRKESDLQLFEFGKVYEKNGDSYEEEERLGLYMAGRREVENWRNSDVFFSYFDLKGFVQSILERFGLLDRCELRDNEKAHLEEGATWVLRGGQEEELVAFGKLDPEMVEEWNMDRPVLMAEFRLDPLFAAYRDEELVYAPLSKQLPVRKDMAFILDRDVRFETVRRTALEAETKYLQEVDLFDVYEGDKVGEGKRSYALKFMFHDPEKTLKDKEIEKAMKRISDSLSEKLGAELRDH